MYRGWEIHITASGFVSEGWKLNVTSCDVCVCVRVRARMHVRVGVEDGPVCKWLKIMFDSRC